MPLDYPSRCATASRQAAKLTVPFRRPLPMASPAAAQSDSRPAATATNSNRPLISFWRGSPARRPHTCLGSDNESGDGCEKEGHTTRKLLETVAIVVIALAPLIVAGTANAHGGGFGGGGFHGGGFDGGGFGRGGFRDRGLRGDRFRFGGIFGGFYPGYYGSYYPGYY
jgi:hypothetical protein